MAASMQQRAGRMKWCRGKHASKPAPTCAPPMGWCTMMRACGRQRRSPGEPAASSSDAIEAAWPTHSVLMGDLMYWGG